ncbi:MAG: AMP-binding protein, partial [bacterium]|nr:AMP-binding protein [bacterium]
MLQPRRDLSRAPLFQVMFVLQTLPAPPDIVAPTGVELTALAIDPGAAVYDLTLSLEQDLSGWIEYKTDLFDAATVARLLKHFRCLAQGAVEAPATRLSALPLLAGAERHQLLAEWNDTATSQCDERPFPELFELWAERAPDAPAVVFDDRVVSYRELDRRTNQLARHLRGRGVGREVLVGICVRRSPEMVVGILGILKAGGAWLPLDPGYPRERLAFMITDSRVGVVLTQEHLLGVLPDHEAHVVRLDAD